MPYIKSSKHDETTLIFLSPPSNHYILIRQKYKENEGHYYEIQTRNDETEYYKMWEGLHLVMPGGYYFLIYNIITHRF